MFLSYTDTLSLQDFQIDRDLVLEKFALDFSIDFSVLTMLY